MTIILTLVIIHLLKGMVGTVKTVPLNLGTKRLKNFFEKVLTTSFICGIIITERNERNGKK